MNKPSYWLLAYCLIFFSLKTAAENQSISQWLEDFAEQGITVIYSSDFMSSSLLNQPISLEPANINSLAHALQNHGLQLEKIDDNIYVINKVSQEPKTYVLIHAFDESNNKSIQAFQLSFPNGEKIPSIRGTLVLSNVTTNILTGQVSANEYYGYSINTPLKQGQTNIIHINLKPLPLALSDLHVSTSLTSFNNTSNSQHSLSRQELNQLSSINHDPLRVTERLPGTASNGINGKQHIRGGQLNESMVVLDNRELRSPYHFKDFYALFSTINDSVVESIDFYSGVFPVQFGGRLSGVIDLQSNQWVEKTTHEINLGLIASSYTYKHEDQENDNQYLVSLRSGGQLINEHVIEDLSIKPEFDDAYFKAKQYLNNHWQMSQHLLVSRDEIVVDQDDESARADYHDQNIWLQWFFDDFDRHQLNWQLYGSRRHDTRIGLVNDDNSMATVNEELISHFQGIKFQHQWQYSADLLFEYGIDVATEDTRINSQRILNHQSELTEALGLSQSLNRSFEFDEHGLSAKLYANTRYQLTPKLTFDLGFHYQYQQWNNGGGLSPRFNVAYFSSNNTTWRFGLGRHQQTQHIDELMLEDIEPEYFEPASADLAVLEYNRMLENGWTFRGEIYYKKYSQTQPYYENLFNGNHVLPDLYYDRIRITPNDTKSAGAEFSINGQIKRMDWSASYTYADVKDEINHQQIARSWNQRNAIKLYLGIPVQLWRLDLTLNFHNGWPMTRIEESNGDLLVSERNQSTFKDFYLLNLNLNRSWQSQQAEWSFELQLNNALNIENPCCRDYQLNGTGLEYEVKNGLPIVPNINFKVTWD